MCPVNVHQMCVQSWASEQQSSSYETLVFITEKVP